MATQATGAQAYLAIQEESTFKTDPGTPDMQKIYIVTESLRLNMPRESSAVLQGSRNPTQPFRGRKDVSGDINTVLQAYIGILFKAAMGSVTTTGTGPYEHVFKIGSSLPSLVIEKGFTDLDTPQYFKYNGCKIASMSLSITDAGEQDLTFGVIGAKESVSTSPFDSTLTDLGKSTFNGLDIGTIQEGGSDIAIVTAAEITLENNLDGDLYVVGGDGERAAVPEGGAKVSGKITALFDSITLYTKAIDSMETSLKFGYALGSGGGSSGNEEIEFYLPELHYTAQSPTIDGQSGIMVELSFEAYYDDNPDATAMKITLKNTQSSI